MTALLTNAEMAHADRCAIAGGISGLALMENAGAAVAQRAVQYSAAQFLVVAGPGNNGGDGYVAARLLAQRGFSVRVLRVGDRGALKGDAAEMARRFDGEVAAATPDAFVDLPAESIVIDALFGAGLDRPVAGMPRAVIEAINTCGRPVIAVDLASGVNGTTGEVMGVGVRARESVTFFRRKPGHLLYPGAAYCGTVRVADIGIPASVLDIVKPRTFENDPALWGGAFPFPRLEGHKYGRGHAVVVSGALHSTGAARLAARGALRAGAGLVSLATPREALSVNAAASLAVMVKPVDGPVELGALLADRRFNVVILGPGLGVGAATRELVTTALCGQRAVVLDADALTSFAGASADLAGSVAGRGGAPTVLTPHEGEFARLFGERSEAASGSKLDRCRAAARAAGAVVVLKGPDTVVAVPDGRACINANAPPWLATAGSGDVLAGLIGGLLAQGMPAFEAACAAVWVHGETGSEAGIALIAEDLPDAVPAVYRRLYAALRGA